MLCGDISVQPVCQPRAGGVAIQFVEFASGKRLGLDDERGNELQFEVADQSLGRAGPRIITYSVDSPVVYSPMQYSISCRWPLLFSTTRM